MIDTTAFWEARARRFAGDGNGLRAICSYAMPGIYNRSIDLAQRRAMRDLIRTIPADAEVLDYGCGVGRWARMIARRGARVTAVDFSATMLEVAARKAWDDGVQSHCLFVQSDIARLDLGRRFDFILGVTVLQHVLDDEQLTKCIGRLAAHLKPGGRLAMLEAAPSKPTGRADTKTFKVRTLAAYLAKIEAAGLRVEEIRGVDPAPFKVWVVPKFQRMPRPIAVVALTIASLCALPIDLLLARSLIRHSWHKLIVARAPELAP